MRVVYATGKGITERLLDLGIKKRPIVKERDGIWKAGSFLMQCK